MTSVWEFLAVLAFGLAVVYLVIERVTGERSTGVIVVPLVTLLLALSSSFIRHDREVPDILRTPWFDARSSSDGSP